MNKKKIVLAVIVLVALIVSFIGGQTYSKYITEVKGQGVAEVATWNFKVNGETENLKQVINLKSTVNNETLVNNKIAPGTKGNFAIKLDATGTEVGIKYDITAKNQVNKPTNLKFTSNGKIYDNLEQLLGEAGGIINANDPNKVKQIQIAWEWKYETGENPSQIGQNDKIDTQNGITAENFTFEIYVTGTQIMPNA